MERQISLQHTVVDVREVSPILEGKLDNLPPLTSKMVRVFLSSTFSDMVHERNALMESVYPELKEFCRVRFGLEFQMVDLRWGIREESQDDHSIIEFCLNEIKNCMNASIGPSFVALIGQKYGYRPFPPHIKAGEFEIIRQSLIEDKNDVELLDSWYKIDLNEIPPVYKLQPISSLLPNYNSKTNPEYRERDKQIWGKVFHEIQKLLRMGVMLCVKNRKLTTKEKEKYFISVTEYELEVGMFNQKNVAKDCLCFFREIRNLPDLVKNERAPRYIDLIPGQKVLDHDAQRYLNILKHDKIPKYLQYEEIIEYLEHTWNSPDSEDPSEDKEYLRYFCFVFKEKLKKLIIKSATNLKSTLSSSYVTEVLQHLTMCNQRRQVFRGRQDILEKLHRYLLVEQTCQPLVIYGESGTGKTSVMAKLASLIREWLPDKKPTIILRFLGTTARSCSIRLVLGNVCWQIASVYGRDTTTIPSDYPHLVKYFQDSLLLATPERPLVMILDSLDQLTATHRAHNLSWLPIDLPPNVHVIVSTIPIENDILKTLKTLIMSEENFIRVLPLGRKLSFDLIKTWLDGASRRLTTEQYDIVEKALERCSLPLYTRLIFEEVCRWYSYSTPDQTRLEFSVKGVINKLFDRVEKYFGETFVKHALSYLTASKNGLSDVEIEDILSLDDVVLNDVFLFWMPPTRRIPPLLWPRLHNELAAYVIQREVNGTMVFYWYHRQFINVARERYLSNLAHKLYIHSSLAHFFQGIWGGGKVKAFTYSEAQAQLLNLECQKCEADRKVPEQPLVFGHASTNLRGKKIAYNLRKLSELPYQLVEAKRKVDMKKEVLFNYDWLHTKLSAMSLPDLLSDFQYAMEHGINDHEIQLLCNALRVGGTHVNNNPDTLAFDLVGRLLPYYDSHLNIRNLIQQCDMFSVKHSVLQPMFPCYESPNGMLLYILEDHTQHVYDLVFSHDSNELISISKDTNVVFWDLASGERTRTINVANLKPGPNTKLFLSSDGRYLVVDSDAIQSPVHIYDVKTGLLVHSCGKRLATQRRGFLVGHLLCRQKNIIDIRKGEVIKTLDDFVATRTYVTCSMTPNGRFILIGEEKSIKLFDFHTGKCEMTFPGANLPCMFYTTSDSRHSYVGYAEDCLFKVLDIYPGSKTFGKEIRIFNYKTAFPHAKFLEGPKFGKELAEISVSPKDESIVLLNIKRCQLVVYKINCVEGPNACLMDAKAIHANNKTFLFGTKFSSDGNYVLAGVEHFLHVWNAKNGQLLSTLTLHSVYKYPLAVSTKSNLVATGSLIHTAIKIWDLDKLEGNIEGDLRVYENPVDMVAVTPGERVAYVKKYFGLASGKGYKYLDSFGIDVWNLCTGHVETLLMFEKYGRLFQMEVSIDGNKLALLLGNREESHLHIVNIRTNKVMQTFSHHGCRRFVAAPMWNFFATCAIQDTSKEVKLWDIATGHVTTFSSAECPVFTLDCQHMLYIDRGDRIIAYSLSKYAPASQLMCHCDRLQMVPNKHHIVITTSYPSESETDDSAHVGEKYSDVSLWYFSSGKHLLSLDMVAPNGILDISKDGKLAVDGFLQVFDLKTGDLKRDLNCVPDSDVVHRFAKFTFDGKYVIWVDGLSVKVSKVASARVLANISTHEKPTSLEVVEYGYMVLLGREDGHVLVMKLVPEDHAVEGRLVITNRLDRAKMLWEKASVNQSAVVTLDPLYQKMSKPIKDHELPRLSDDVRHSLQQKAKVPLAIIKTASLSDISGYDSLGRSRTTPRRGSSPMSVWMGGSRSRDTSPCDSPSAQEGKSTFFIGSLRNSLELHNYNGEKFRRESSPMPAGIYSAEDGSFSASPMQGSPVVRAKLKFNRKRSKSAQDLLATENGKSRSKSFQDLISALASKPIPHATSKSTEKKLDKRSRRKSPGFPEMPSTSKVLHTTGNMMMGLMNIGSSTTLPNRKKPPIPPKKQSLSRKSDSDLPPNRDRTPSV